jgi:hypothetical protein
MTDQASPISLSLPYRSHLVIMSGLARLAEQDADGPWQEVHDEMLKVALAVAYANYLEGK